MIGPYYSEGKRGAQPYPLELMIRIHFLQLVYNLSDPICEETLHDSFACRRFVGYNLSDPICEETLHDSFACRRFVGLTMDSKCPDETTILRFRHLLEKNGLDKQVFDLFKQQLTARGLLFSKGTIVDGSFIEAPSSTKNADKKRDPARARLLTALLLKHRVRRKTLTKSEILKCVQPEMRSAKKGSNWHFGMKMHIGVDKATGIIHTVITTPANVQDVTKADELRRPDDWDVLVDSGYLGMEKRESADPERVTYTAAKRYGQRKKLSAERVADEKVLSSIRCKVEHAFHRIAAKRYGQRKKLSAERVADEKVLSSIRCKVEHAFHRIKVQFGYRKVRYRGLAKNTARLTMPASIANMFIGNCFENRTKVSFV